MRGEKNNRNITWHEGLTHKERIEKRGQKGLTIWLTGLSASGKSTIAEALERLLVERGVAAYRLDGQSIFIIFIIFFSLGKKSFFFLPFFSCTLFPWREGGEGGEEGVRENCGKIKKCAAR